MNNCCICGTVRNVGRYLDKIFANMEQFGNIFDNYIIFLYYDKSTDNTLQKLKEYQLRNSKFQYYINENELLPYRTHRLALGRNHCLTFIKENYIDYKYFIMMDCDDVCNYNINLDLFKSYLKREDWDALSFHHPRDYYDIWALSISPYILSYFHLNCLIESRKYITNIINNTPSNELIPCLSAFNGFSIYITNKFIDCKYDGRLRFDYILEYLIKENIKYNCKNFDLNKDDKEDCEHRAFHFEAIIKNNARIRISPNYLFK
jgi:hypothetical protein